MGLALGSTVPWRKAVIRVGNLPAQKVCDAAVPGGVGRLALEAEALQNSGTSPWQLVQGKTTVQCVALLGVPSIWRAVSGDKTTGPGLRVQVLALLCISYASWEVSFTFGPVFSALK